ncbi:hypothetical protein L6164_010295 [Bauhinia variegata]|uniref:Uncharacterized protein n=1 Tax=Bauhinia variegata TaxID=167791 RepID=A0ACB9PLU1_BAUVA|nr:hypothetical protein L6164_010295 [Bauhinia variegata]
MDMRKCIPSGGASSLNVAPLSFSNQVDEMAQSSKDKGVNGHAVETDVDIDLREIYFLIMHFLSAGPCQRTFRQFWNELLEHQLLPRRYHAWFSRSGVSSGDDNDDGISCPLNYQNLVDRYPHIAKDHLVKLLKQLMLNTAPPLLGKLGGSAPSATDVPTLLGYASFSLLNIDRKMADKQVKPFPVYLRWPHMQANQVQGLNLREIGGGFTKHHRPPSIRSACYAIAKPSTMVQRMQNIKKLRGHRVAVYCAIFDRSGRYVISGSDDRLVKIWSMETAFCLASCRGHEGDITDLAVSSNNVLVASASNDFVIRVWRLPDGVPISVLRGHTGAVNTIAFSPRPNAAYQLLSSSDDGTCRIWDARSSLYNPRIYLPRPSDAITGKSSGPPTNLTSSSSAQQSHQILCCAYNANGTVFVTGSSDTFARVWSALKSNSDDSEQPIHEMDLLSGHENDVNYVQFSGCSVASKFLTSDSLKEENVPKFRNFWFCHDNIVTCSRDGSAIIWVPRSRRSHGKVGRWVRAYHLKVPPPPLPPQPPRGGPRQRFLPTPRGVNMIIWSLDNRFVLAAIMDCRICVWNAVDGSLVHSLTGHTESSYVLDVHPFNPRIAMSAGYDGRTIVWDIWEGIPIRTYEIGRFKLVDGKFSPDGTSIVLSDDVGQIYLLSTGQGESQKDAKYDQFFLGDYRPLMQDTQGNLVDKESQLQPHIRNIQDPLCDSSMVPYPEPYQSQYQQRRLGALGIEWRPSLIKYAIGPDFSVGQDNQVMPLADLERMVEPQPEFIEALYWEPEIEVVSDDNDSEYNANEDNNSEAEQESVTAISSSDVESSEEDSQIEHSNRDGLRRSRRRKPDVEVELKTSGRRVRKRNLDDCDGTPSGSNRTKKSKSNKKSSKWKSFKAKTMRPQRIAARNARNMFSQISGTSTDAEDEDDSEDGLSDNVLDLEVLSESERNMQNKHDEHKQPPLDEFAIVTKHPTHSESQGNAENKPRLVLKFSLRDSKKNVPLEDTRHKSDNQADMAGQSSRPQESAQETEPERSSGEPAVSCTDLINAELSQSGKGNDPTNITQAENGTNHLEASVCVEGNMVQHRDVKILTTKLSTSGDAMLNHREHNANGRMEQVITGELESVGSLNHTEVPHLDYSLKSSSLESSLPGNGMHQQNGDASLASGDEKLNDGYQDWSESDKCRENSLERNEVVHSSHVHDLKMKAPLHSTKLIIRKKQSSADMKGPCKLNFVSSGNSSFMTPNPTMEEQHEGEDNGKLSSLQLSHLGSNRKIIDLHQRDRSYEVEVNRDDLGESTSNVSNRHGLGIGVSDTVRDPIHRTPSGRIKTSDEPNALNLRIKVRGGQNFGGMSNRAGSSIEVPDQLHQRSRHTRSRQGGHFVNNPGTSTTMSNKPNRKLSWLMLSEPEEGYRYIPQLGDKVVYLRQGHLEYLESCRSREIDDQRSMTGLAAVEICKVEELHYSWVPGSGASCCKLKLRFVDPSSCMCGESFILTLPELINFPDFVVEKTWYDAVMKRNWSPRDKCMVWWRNEGGDGGSWWSGRILSAQAKSHEFPDSPWEKYMVQYKSEPTENHLHCPWELYDPEILWEHPHIDHEIRDKLLTLFNKLEHRDKYGIEELNRAAEKPEFLNRFAVPLYPELVKTRLKNDYYRSVKGVKLDIMVMLSNAEDFFPKNAELLGKVRRLSDRFKRKFERI